MGPKTEHRGKRMEERSIGSIYDQGKNEFYKPFALKWPFIVTIIFLLTHTLTLVVYVQQITPYFSGNSWEEMKLKRPEASMPRTKDHLQPTSSIGFGTESTQSYNVSTTAPRQIERREVTTVTNIELTTLYITSFSGITVTTWQPTTVTATVITTQLTTIYTTSYSDRTVTLWQTTTETTEAISTAVRTITYTTSYSYPVTQIGATTIWYPMTETVTSIYISYLEYRTSFVQTYIRTTTEEIYLTDSFSNQRVSSLDEITIPIEGISPETVAVITQSALHTTIETTDQSGVATTVTTVMPPVVLTSVIPGGRTTMLFKTILNGDVSRPLSLVVYTTVPGPAVTRVRTPSPFTYTTVVSGVETAAVSTPSPEIYVTRDGSVVSALVTVVITPGPGLVTEGSSIKTVIESQSPTTYTTNISGLLTTIISTPIQITKLSTIPVIWNPKTVTRSPRPKPEPPSKNETSVIFSGILYNITPGEYFTGAFLPTLIAILLGIPISIIDINAGLVQPFHALNSGGVQAALSLDISFSGPINSFVMPHRLLLQRQPVTYITSLLEWTSWLLVPLASEAVGLQVFGRCSRFSIEGCAVSLGVSSSPKNALVVLLAAMVILLLILLYYLRNWNTGIYCYPWSIAGIATLTADARIRQMVAQRIQDRSEQVTQGFKNTRFRLGVSAQGHYTILTEDHVQEAGPSPPKPKQKTENRSGSRCLCKIKQWILKAKNGVSNASHSPHTPFICLTYTWRFAFVAFHMAVLGLVIYYRVAQNTRTADILGFKPGFGSRFLFSALGKIISLFWSDFLISMATIHPFVLLSPPHPPQPASSSILIPRPTNEFSVIFRTMTQLITTKGNLKANFSLILASFVAILSKFLPVLMTNIPYTLQQTYPSYIVCTTISIAVLSLMIVTLLGSVLLIGNWPYLPSDPRTIAGMMYYLLNSSFYDPDPSSNGADSPSPTTAEQPDRISPAKPTSTPGKVFAGLGHLKQAERDKQITDLNYRYAYGELLPTRETHSTTQNAQSFPNSSTLSHRKKTSKTQRTMCIYIEHGNSAA